ncbi:bifunctional Serine-threonine-specific protein phosphatase-bis(5-nucleosyl)-tetraphosphatase/Metallo-dependent phosphatase-like/Calcineurin-like phosphoesterase domain [Babesia duncani]|uniref:Serine/threonine-protein phosphatase n=1 Tax=Babesia duncani TaxID=323732 RepID=A0AAD9UMV7_9APIC|nr:bifunctional Serine-threonine-specific protein phosphatase-bis(5-nucleosyl)-tetraphosphatase/Metallo-dependent phosphatase-like/Calcineurin-like phosphoesterase domain [Babesia duncani]
MSDDRILKDVIPPPVEALEENVLFPEGPDSAPDWKALMNHFEIQGKISRSHCVTIIRRARIILENEPNVLHLQEPLNVVGDIHGQFYDLLKILNLGNCPSTHAYLFLGDYVDRGSFGVEVVLLLYAIKINYPETFNLIRGNHESRQLTSFFNFKTECKVKFDLEVYEEFLSSFHALPIAAIVNNRYLLVHGGISPNFKRLQQLDNINRKQDPPSEGLLCDILWADPYTDTNESNPCGTINRLKLFKSTEKVTKYAPNKLRCCSWTFGIDATRKFLKENGLLCIIRAHEAQFEGYKMHYNDLETGFPKVITIFSAPNYCDIYKNKAAILHLNNSTMSIHQFASSPHPYHLPNFMDIFTWSIPFISEKVLEMLDILLIGPAEHDNINDVVLPSDLQEYIWGSIPQRSLIISTRGDAMRAKIQSVARLMIMFKALRMRNEMMLSLGACAPASHIPVQELIQQQNNDIAESFINAQAIDSVNERRPQDIDDIS